MQKQLYAYGLAGLFGFIISFLFSILTNSLTTSLLRGLISIFIFFLLAIIYDKLIKYILREENSTIQDTRVVEEKVALKTNNVTINSEENFEHLASFIKNQLKESENK